MASRIRRTLHCLEATDPERPPRELTSDLLEEIFLRVASPADLARASTVCVFFRRLISDPSFLRRYRSIHPPLFLGLISGAGFTPADAPHPSAAVARSIARATNFSFDYLPRTEHGYDWRPCDVSDGRVLVKCSRNDPVVCLDIAVYDPVVYLDIAVCDPLFRQYLLLPPITHDQLASVGFQNPLVQSRLSFIPSGSGGLEETSFSVISCIYSRTSWSVGTATSCDDLGLHDQLGWLCSFQRVYGHIYWRLYGTSKLIRLDMNSMEFSTVNLPPDHDSRSAIIVESCGSNVAMFSVMCRRTYVDYYTLLKNGNGKSHEWHLMSTISLPEGYINSAYMMGPAEGYICLECIPIEKDVENVVFVSLEVESFKVERVCTSRFGFRSWPYFGFPPSMSSVRIQ